MERNSVYTRHGHGVTKQVRGAIKAFAQQAADSPPEISSEPIVLAVACPCSYLPYPHHLHGAEKERHDSGDDAGARRMRGTYERRT